MPNPAVDLSADTASLSAIIDCMPSGLCVVDADGRICIVNGSFERTFGYHRQDLIGAPLERLLPERHRAAHVHHRGAFLKRPEQRAMGARLSLFGLRADGTEVPVEVGLTPLRVGDQPLVVATVIDLSARRSVEEAFSAVVQATPTPTLIVGEDGCVESANSRAEEIFGFGPGQMRGRSVDELLPERYRGGHPNHRERYLAEPTMRAMGKGRDLTAQHCDGREIPVEIGLNPVAFNGKRLVIVSVVDLTERKKLELELRQANANLEEFTYVASHDLKSPLRGIANLVEWIGEDIEGGELDKVRSNLARVHLRVERMEAIIEDLLAYARAGRRSRDLVDVELRSMLEGICELQPRPDGIEVQIEVVIGAFKAARVPLETVMRNLIGNAIKHHDKSCGRVTITATQDDHFCVLKVSDDGPGIPVAAQDRVFRLFQTLSATERQGSGIGLALTKRLVEAHGGSIEVENNTPATGATFTVRWPRFPRRDLDE